MALRRYHIYVISGTDPARVTLTITSHSLDKLLYANEAAHIFWSVFLFQLSTFTVSAEHVVSSYVLRIAAKHSEDELKKMEKLN